MKAGRPDRAQAGLQVVMDACMREIHRRLIARRSGLNALVHINIR